MFWGNLDDNLDGGESGTSPVAKSGLGCNQSNLSVLTKWDPGACEAAVVNQLPSRETPLSHFLPAGLGYQCIERLCLKSQFPILAARDPGTRIQLSSLTVQRGVAEGDEHGPLDHDPHNAGWGGGHHWRMRRGRERGWGRGGSGWAEGQKEGVAEGKGRADVGAGEGEKIEEGVRDGGEVGSGLIWAIAG